MLLVHVGRSQHDRGDRKELAMRPLQLSPVKLNVLQHLKVDHVCLDVVVVTKVDLWIVRKGATH